MDLRQLEMVIAVADNASFTKAGQQLHVAQSAVSRKIQLLENEFGERFFKRVSKKVYLTPAGETLLRYARKVFQELRNASLEISDLARLERGQLRIGGGMIACTYILPPVLEKFKALYPRIELQVVTGSTDTLMEKLRDNSIELGVFTLPVRPQPHLTVIPFSTDEMVVIASARHPTLAAKRWIRAAELERHPVIIFPKGTHTRGILDTFFRQAAIIPQITMETENASMIKQLVRINLGISIIPLRAVAEEVRRKELHCLRIRGHKVVRQAAVVFHKSDNPPRVLSELVRQFQISEKPPT